MSLKIFLRKIYPVSDLSWVKFPEVSLYIMTVNPI